MNMGFAELLDKCRAEGLNARVDSRKVTSGDIFVAMPGSKVDGASFAAEAAQKGASWIVCPQELASSLEESLPDIPIVAVPDASEALWRLAQARWRTDENALDVIGVTGTNGKTTCAWLLDYLFQASGRKTGLLGTISYKWPGHSQSASLTTPDALELHEILASMKDAGADLAIMEVSSHALSQARAGGIGFKGAIFTNLTQDHLDYHKDMEDYFRAKARLFFELPQSDKKIAINADDPYGRRLLELLPGALPYGLHGYLPLRRQLIGRIEELAPQGMTLEMRLGKIVWKMRSRLVGAFNALNLLAVQALALEMGFSPKKLEVLETFNGVPGRLERIDNRLGAHVFVDYAHTPDALVNALRALRGAGFKRIVTVFGCGGNRDRTKRPLMGQAVAEYSDVAVLTSDNPRLEDPARIMEDVKPGLLGARSVFCEADRRKATELALGLLNPGDVLLIAGKGHEDYQIIGTERRHYSDQEIVRELLS